MTRPWLWVSIFILFLGNLYVWYFTFYRVGNPAVASPKSSLSLLPSLNTPTDPVDQTAGNLKTGTRVAVPILMYHYIRDYRNPQDPLGEQLSVSPAKFREQLALIKNSGYQTISLENFASGKIAKQSIILTFDDGYLDHYTAAFPLLQEFKMTGTFFIVRDFQGQANYMSKFQVAELEAAGMEIGSHSLNHKNLASMEYEKAVADISLSMVNRDSVFAYPAGKYSPTTLDIIDALDIKAAVTTNLGVATENSSLLELPRIRIKEKTDILKRIKEETLIARGELSTSQRSKD